MYFRAKYQCAVWSSTRGSPRLTFLALVLGKFFLCLLDHFIRLHRKRHENFFAKSKRRRYVR